MHFLCVLFTYYWFYYNSFICKLIKPNDLYEKKKPLNYNNNLKFAKKLLVCKINPCYGIVFQSEQILS